MVSSVELVLRNSVFFCLNIETAETEHLYYIFIYHVIVTMTAILTDNGVRIKMSSYIKDCPRKPNGSLNQFITTVFVTRDIKKTTMAHRIEGEYLYLPRSGAFQLLEKNYLREIINELPEPKKATLQYTGKLTQNQKIVLKYIVRNCFNKSKVKKGNATCSIIMKAGRGKTYLAMGLIHVLQQKTLVIVPTDKLMFGWKKELAKYFNPEQVGIYYSKKKEDRDIVVMMIHTAISDNTTQDYINQFGLVIYDEVHKYCSPIHSKIFWKATNRYILAMTATPSRVQQEDIVFRNQVGPVIDAQDVPGYIKDDVKFVGEVRVIKYQGPSKYTRQLRNPITKNNSAPALITQVTEDPYRNQMIVEETLRIYNEGHDAFIFSDRLEHLDTLQMMLIANKIEKSFVLTGGASEEFTREAYDGAIILLTTYQASDTGVSIDRMTGLILSTPRRNLMEQKLGRILRIGGDLSVVRQVVDVVDQNVSLKSQYPNRRKVYKKEGFSINEIDVSWESYQTYGNPDES